MVASREQMYGLLDAFERDMREVFDRFVLTEVAEAEAAGDGYEEADSRRTLEGDLSSPIVQFLDLRPTYDLLNRHRDLLPGALAAELRELTPELDVILPIRRRIAHARPLVAGDHERLVSALNKFATRWWVNTASALAALRASADWVPDDLPPVRPDEVGHNLPLPEYDETGLLGRDEDVKMLANALKRGRDAVVTLAGEGGIGKTALALEVAYHLLDDPDKPFQVILWASLKTERLTGTGVELLRGAVDTIVGAADALGQGLRGDFQGGIEALGAALEGLRTLVVIDNLETVDGSDFIQLYEGLPDTVRFLVTSREGIGQLERRIRIGPLEEKYALAMLNQLIRYRKVPSLSKIPGPTRVELIRRLRRSPLAIRWFILAVEAGRPAADALQNQDELLDFCVSSVFAALSSGARRALVAMEALGRPVTADDLVLLTGGTVKDVMAALQELTRGSLVTSFLTAEGSMSTTVEPTETARQFIAKVIPPDDPARITVMANEAQFRQDEERRELEAGRRSLAPIVVRTRFASDAPTAQLLRRALFAAQAEDTAGALELVREAAHLNPDFWEVHRVAAFINAAAGNSILATRLYREAYRSAEWREHRAVVAHFFGGHLARNERDLDQALRYARESHEVLDAAETAASLGNLEVWSCNFEQGIALLETASKDSLGKARLIAVTALVEAHRRRSEYVAKEDHNPVVACSAAIDGFRIAQQELVGGIVDSRLKQAACEVAAQAVRTALAAMAEGHRVTGVEELLESLIPLLPAFGRERRWRFLVDYLMRLAELPGAPAAASRAVTVAQRQEAVHAAEAPGPDASARFPIQIPAALQDRISSATAQGWLVGEVVSVHQGFGFIRHPDYPSNVFFPRSVLGPIGDSIPLVPGQTVFFSVCTDPFGRIRAPAVSTDVPDGAPPVEAPEASSATSTAIVASGSTMTLCHVERMLSDKGFGFAAAPDSSEMFFHQSVCEPGLFPTLTVGTAVLVAHVVGPDGRARATQVRAADEGAGADHNGTGAPPSRLA